MIFFFVFFKFSQTANQSGLLSSRGFQFDDDDGVHFLPYSSVSFPQTCIYRLFIALYSRETFQSARTFYFLHFLRKTTRAGSTVLRKIPYKFDMIFISSHRQFDFCLELHEPVFHVFWRMLEIDYREGGKWGGGAMQAGNPVTGRNFPSGTKGLLFWIRLLF